MMRMRELLRQIAHQQASTEMPEPTYKPRRYFGTDGIRGKVGVWPITPEFVLKLGWAIGMVLARSGYGKVLIGKDTRISGYMFESVLEAGLSSAGIDTHLLGPMPTPAIAYLTRTLRAQAGIVISASHNLFDDNGIKFFSHQGIKLPDHIEQAIEAQLEEPMTTVPSVQLGKAIRVVDAPGRYIEFCKSTVASDMILTGLKIVVDCANGAAYHIAPSVFRELGAEVIELAVEPDGLNINLNCGATAPEALQQRVLSEKADLGIALDGDGDRVMMVDHLGHVLDGDDLLYIIAKHRYHNNILQGGIVGTVMSNLGFEKALNDLGIEFVRVPVGDRHIMAELIKRNWHLGGEPSGHIVCLATTTTGDGIITALQVLAGMREQEQNLSDIRQGLKKYPQVLLNIRTDQSDRVISSITVQEAVTTVEIEMKGRGRVLLRKSGTEPLIRIMVEGETQPFVEHYAKTLAQIVEEEISVSA